MATEHDGGTPHPPLPLAVAQALLDRLGQDDGFRELFVKDPRGALREIGLDAVSAEAALAGGSCLEVQALASKAELAAAREALMEQLVGIGPHTSVFCFEAGEAGAAKRRK